MKCMIQYIAQSMGPSLNIVSVPGRVSPHEKMLSRFDFFKIRYRQYFSGGVDFFQQFKLDFETK